MIRKIRTSAFLFALALLPFAAFSQTYPSQPTFQKCGVGIGPNVPEVVTLWGGTTPIGACWIAQQTNGDGGFIGFIARETGVDPTTKLFSVGAGVVGGTLGQFYVNAPWGNPIELFADAGGASGVLSLGVGGSTDRLEIRTTARIAYANGIGATLDFRDSNTVLPVDEQFARFNHLAGNFTISSLTDAGGAGQTLFTADRDGVNWQNVALTAQLGSLTLTGQSQATLTSSVSTTVSAGTGDINITGNASSQIRLSGSNTLRLGTPNTAGARILFDDNTAESIDYDIRGALGNTAGDLQVFTRTQFASGVRMNDGSAGTPSYSFASDTNTGMYSAGADTIGFSAGGSLAASITATAYQQNGSCNTAATPCFSFVTDPDTGMYRSAANTVGLVAGGSEKLKCDTTTCTVTGDLTVTGTLSASGAGSVYACTVDSAATAEVCSTGWSVASNGSGDYTVTHNLGLANANNMAITVTPFATVSNACRVDSSNIGVNSFHYTCYTTSSGSAADSGAMLTAIRIQ